MTVRFLQSWAGYQPDQIVSGLSNEAALIAAGLAAADLDGANDGTESIAKWQTDASGNVAGLVGPDGNTLPLGGFTAMANYAGDKVCAAAGANLREAVPADAVAWRVTNASDYGVYVAAGGSDVLASVGGTLVAAGITSVFALNPSDTHIAYASADTGQTPTINVAYGS